jgi:hypothetical protein
MARQVAAKINRMMMSWSEEGVVVALEVGTWCRLISESAWEDGRMKKIA